MLSKAREKLSSYITSMKAEIKQHCLPTIPFPDNHFEIVFFSFVLHHLDKNDLEFVNAKRALKEAYRVLRPGGIVVVVTIAQKQACHGFWFLSLLPQTTIKNKEKFMPENDLLSYVHEIGFRNRSSFTSYDEVLMSEELYRRLDGPLDPNWRQMVSVWSIAEAEGELQNAINEATKLRAEGHLENFFEQAEQKRKQVGSNFTVFAQKPTTVD